MVDILVHLSNKFVDLFFPIANISMVFFFISPLKGQLKLFASLKSFLMNEILHADDAVFTKRSKSHCVTCQCN